MKALSIFLTLVLITLSVQSSEAATITEQIRSKTNKILEDTRKIKNDTKILDDIPGKIMEGLNIEMSGDLRNRLLSVAEQAQQALNAEDSDMSSFNCEGFRAKLKNVINQGSTLTNAALGDLGKLPIAKTRQIVDLAPCPALFPISKSMEAFGVPINRLATSLRTQKETLLQSMELINSEKADTADADPNAPTPPDDIHLCHNVWQDKKTWSRRANILVATGLSTFALGKYLDPDAELNLGPRFEDTSMGLHGYFDLTIAKPKPKKYISLAVVVAGEAQKAVGSYLHRKVTTCKNLAAVCQNYESIEKRADGPACWDEGFSTL